MGVDFAEAARVFDDPLHLILADRVVEGEERWHAWGCSHGEGPLLLVVHVYWEEDDGDAEVQIIRIVSARRADSRERRAYEQERQTW